MRLIVGWSLHFVAFGFFLTSVTFWARSPGSNMFIIDCVIILWPILPTVLVLSQVHNHLLQPSCPSTPWQLFILHRAKYKIFFRLLYIYSLFGFDFQVFWSTSSITELRNKILSNCHSLKYSHFTPWYMPGNSDENRTSQRTRSAFRPIFRPSILWANNINPLQTRCRLL